MSNLPMEIVNEILEYNNSKLVVDKKTNSYVFRFISYVPYTNVENLLSAITIKGKEKPHPMTDCSVSWFEIYHSNKWLRRCVRKIYADKTNIQESIHILDASCSSVYCSKSIVIEKSTIYTATSV
jgi:hypothetical protein